ncbi:ChbG/HpnK family deacetylase [Azospirillum sp.]|uniref:ChbG/HpnK family deacetylase n=1 Tax=Azospirillum sp. TaxID=34012 RepID=UPI002D2593E0|nr:ChbG/HpnK family deacetylase [Azospirillum sp.]HYD66235.1 ChbG/HpnK family deacetylase [Azospirillum sp.]
MPHSAHHPVILCADDYGLSPGVGAAIRDLIERGRLTATSCMTVCPSWPAEATLLKPLADMADVGLHLTLTDQRPLGPMPALAPNGTLPPLGALMRKAFSGALKPAEITAEVDRQVAAFTEHFGAPPAYIDGHQHVHQLPVVRDAVAAALSRLPGAYVRLCREPRRAIVRRGVAVPKTLLISELGGGLAALARASGIPGNTSFRGVYDFSGKVPFGDLMARFLDEPGGRTLVMVHPGIPDEELRRADPLVDQRAVEYDYLKGPAFADLLAARGLRLGRFAEAGGNI